MPLSATPLPQKQAEWPVSVRQAMAPKSGKPCLMVVLPWLQLGGAEILMHDILEGLADAFDFVILTTIADTHILRRRFDSLKADILHLDENRDQASFAQLVLSIARARGIKTILFSSSRLFYDALPAIRHDAPHLRILDLLHNDLECGHFRTAVHQDDCIDTHICVSEKIRDSFLAHGIGAAKIHVIPNGIDSHDIFFPHPEPRQEIKAGLGLPLDRPIMAFVGRASEEKRPLLFLDLLKYLVESRNAFGLCVGNGPMLADIRSKIAALGLQKHILHLNCMAREDLWKIYAASDLLINVSEIEGMPLTLLEALATGCPAAAMQVGNVDRAIVDGENGILVAKDDFKNLIARIDALLGNPVKLEAMRSKARTLFLRSGYDKRLMVKNYQALLSSADQADPRWPLIVNLVQLDVFGASGDVSRPLSDIRIKLAWNLFLKNKYGETVVPFHKKEKTHLMESVTCRGFTVPRFIAEIDRLFTENFLNKAHRDSNLSASSFEFFLINYILFIQETLFTGVSAPPDVWDWFSQPSPNIPVAPAPPLSKLMMAVYFATQELKTDFDLATRHGYLGYIGWFCRWKAIAFQGYRHPAWLRDFLDNPVNDIPEAATLGISGFIECLWHFNNPSRKVFDAQAIRDIAHSVDPFIRHQAAHLEHYDHPDWMPPVPKGSIPQTDVEPEKKTDPPPQSGVRHITAAAVYEKGGVNLIGWPRTEIGIGEDIRVAADALQYAKLSFVVMDAFERTPSTSAQKDLGLESFVVDKPRYGVDLVFLDAATQYRYYSFDLIKGGTIDRPIIAVSPWELPHWPQEIAFALKHVSVFWAATRYIRDAFKPYFADGNIFLAPPAVVIPPEQIDTLDLTAIDQPFRFLTTFDGLSSIHRKNPIAVVRAFQQAFPRGQNDVRLVIKMMNLANDNDTLRELMERVQTDERIQIINRTLSRKELSALVRASHCFVSLHRAEGFGRNIAESMLFGRPVICSAYSGNVDFCSPDTAYMVGGREIAVARYQYAYSEGQTWFDPSVEEAAAHMRDVYQNRAKAQTIAKAGQAYIADVHSIASTGARYRDLLKQIIAR